MREILKVKIINRFEKEFEQYCKERKIFFKPYPNPITCTYRVECKREQLHDIGHAITTIEPMPIATLD